MDYKKELRKKIKTNIEECMNEYINCEALNKYRLRLTKRKHSFYLRLYCKSKDIYEESKIEAELMLDEFDNYTINYYKINCHINNYTWVDFNDNNNLKITYADYESSLKYDDNKTFKNIRDFLDFFIISYKRSLKIAKLKPWAWSVGFNRPKKTEIMRILPEDLRKAFETKQGSIESLSKFISDNGYLVL